ncbi:MAG TPA: NnrS family protein, partial [Gammaproteobacteria bacterium]
HRVMFLGGALQLVLSLLFWSAELLARQAGTTLGSSAVPLTQLHAFQMLFGVFPFFLFGFLMTTYPRWMDGPPVPRGHVLAAFLPMALGVLLAYLAPWAGRAAWALGALLLLAGFVAGSLALWRVYRLAPATDKHYERHLNTVLVAAQLAQLAFLGWLLSGAGWALGAAQAVGLWLFLVPLLLVVGHRMIPYFSSSVLAGYRVVQPRWSLPLAWLAVSGHAACDLLGWVGWRALPDALLFAVALQLTLAWRLRASLQVRLLGVLHLAFAGLALGMALYLLQDLAWLAGEAWLLGRAPLHALGIGFVAAMVVAMASRVSLGHSGRALELDRYGWYCFLGVELALLLRVLAEMPWPLAWLRDGLTLLAALAWLVALGAWTARFAPIYLRPRVDGRAG